MLPPVMLFGCAVTLRQHSAVHALSRAEAGLRGPNSLAAVAMEFKGLKEADKAVIRQQLIEDSSNHSHHSRHSDAQQARAVSASASGAGDVSNSYSAADSPRDRRGIHEGQSLYDDVYTRALSRFGPQSAYGCTDMCGCTALPLPRAADNVEPFAGCELRVHVCCCLILSSLQTRISPDDRWAAGKVADASMLVASSPAAPAAFQLHQTISCLLLTFYNLRAGDDDQERSRHDGSILDGSLHGDVSVRNGSVRNGSALNASTRNSSVHRQASASHVGITITDNTLVINDNKLYVTLPPGAHLVPGAAGACRLVCSASFQCLHC